MYYELFFAYMFTLSVTAAELASADDLLDEYNMLPTSSKERASVYNLVMDINFSVLCGLIELFIKHPVTYVRSSASFQILSEDAQTSIGEIDNKNFDEFRSTALKLMGAEKHGDKYSFECEYIQKFYEMFQ